MHDHTHGTDGSVQKLEETAENPNDNKEITTMLTIFCFEPSLEASGRHGNGPRVLCSLASPSPFRRHTLTLSTFGVALAILLEVNIMLRICDLGIDGLALLMLRQIAPSRLTHYSVCWRTQHWQ